MSFSRLMDKDPESGTETWFHFDDATEMCTIEERRDVQDLIDFNKQCYNEHDEHTPFDISSENMNRVASIPDFIYYDLLQQGITRDPEAMRRWLNDPDNKAWRTRPGRV